MNSYFYVLHIFSCFFMTGLIWLVQLIHYPSYKYIEAQKFTEYQNFHTTTITFIVGPVMLIEIFTGAAILFDQKYNTLSIVNFCGLLVIWLSTAIFSAPLHGKLSAGYNLDTIQMLISTNWIRTLLWSARAGLLTYCLIKIWPNIER